MSELRAPHASLGASLAELAGATVVRRYGDPAAEYRAVREAAGIVERADLALLRLWGRDPVRMLNGLITNDLASAPGGRAVYGAMLTPKGRTISDLRAFRHGPPEAPEVRMAVPAIALDAVTAHLRKFVPPLFARLEDLSDSVGVLGLYGPKAPAVLSLAVGREVAAGNEDDLLELEFGSEPVTALATPSAGGEDGYDLFVAATAVPALWEALLSEGESLGARPIGFGALETLRIEAGRPRYGRELSQDSIPTEAFEAAGLMQRAISFSKGCYTGQEVIVRIAHRGHVNRHLRGLLLGDAPAPAERTPLFHPDSGKEVGWTTSAAISPLLGQTIALGFVRRELEPGDRACLGSPGGTPVTLVSLPFQAAS
jgi:folate-binding protein YgfZ